MKSLWDGVSQKVGLKKEVENELVEDYSNQIRQMIRELGQLKDKTLKCLSEGVGSISKNLSFWK